MSGTTADVVSDLGAQDARSLAEQRVAVATQWQHLAAAGTRLVRFLTPKDLPETAA